MCFPLSIPELLYLYVFYSVFSNFIILFLINKKARMDPLLDSSMSVTIVSSRLRVFGDQQKCGAQTGNIKGI